MGWEASLSTLRPASATGRFSLSCLVSAGQERGTFSAPEITVGVVGRAPATLTTAGGAAVGAPSTSTNIDAGNCDDTKNNDVDY